MIRRHFIIRTLLFSLILIGLISCTKNERARNYGGTETIELKPNEEFINITWKNDDLWVIVKNKNTGKYYAREKSSYGMMEGTIIIK